jgi:hypothetical protein
MRASPNSTPDATDISLDLACSINQASVMPWVLWLALAARSKYLDAGSHRLARRNVLIEFNSNSQETFSAPAKWQNC